MASISQRRSVSLSRASKGEIGDDATLVRSIVSNLLDTQPTSDEDKSYVFYFAELNANHHSIVSYLKTFSRSKQFIRKLKEIVLQEETRSLKIHGMTINILHACMMNLDPHIALDVFDENLCEVLCNFACLTKYYSLAIDILKLAVNHNTMSIRQIIGLFHREFHETIFNSIAKEEKSSPVRRIPPANFYALLWFLQLYLSSSKRLSSAASEEVTSTIVAESDDDLQCIRLIKGLCAFVEVDYRIKYPLEFLVHELRAGMRVLNSYYLNDYKVLSTDIGIILAFLRKFTEILSILTDCNYLEKGLAPRCLHWGVLDLMHQFLSLQLTHYPAIFDTLALACGVTVDHAVVGTNSPSSPGSTSLAKRSVQHQNPSGNNGKEEMISLIDSLRTEFNSAILSALKFGNELMITCPAAFDRTAELYLSNGYFCMLLDVFKSQENRRYCIDNCEVLCEVAVFLGYAQCSDLRTESRVDLFDRVLCPLWNLSLAHLRAYCSQCIEGSAELDANICRNIMAVSKTFAILSSLDFVSADDVPSLFSASKATSPHVATKSISSLLANSALSHRTIAECFSLLKDLNRTGQDRPGWLHPIAECIHNIWDVRRYLEFSQIIVVKVPETLLTACQEIPPDQHAQLLQDKSIETWKQVADSPRDIEIFENIKNQIELDLRMYQQGLEASKGHLQRKLTQYNIKNGTNTTFSSSSSSNSNSNSNSNNNNSNNSSGSSSSSSSSNSSNSVDRVSSSSSSSPNPINSSGSGIMQCDKILGKDQGYIEANLEKLYVNLLLTPTAFYERFGIDKTNIDNFSQILLNIGQKGLSVAISGSSFDPSFIKVRNSLLSIRLLSVIVAHYSLEIALQGKICQFCIENLVQRFVSLGCEPWHYQSMYSLLLILSRHDRQAKRQIVKNLSTLEYQCERAMRSHSLVAVLLLIDESAEFLLRVDDAGEEVVASTSLKAVQMRQFPRLQALSHKIISGVAEYHPGIIHKGIGRRETEDICYNFLSNSLWNSMDELYYLLKASTACLRDVNLKPKWFARTYLYNWRAYKRGLADRPLLQRNMTKLIASLVVSGKGYFVVPIYSQSVALSTALMCNCTDGIISTFLMTAKGGRKANRDQNEFNSSLRDDLLSFMLVYFARALNLVIKQDSVKERDLHYNISLSIAGNKARQTTKDDSTVDQKDKSPTLKSLMSPFKSENKMDSSISSSPDGASEEEGHGVMTTSSSQQRAVSTKMKTSFSRAMEVLAESTVDAIFSFLCLEEMFPLSAYLRNMSTFNRVPVIASVSAIMTRFSTNVIIQKRGLDLFKAFASNNLELSSIAMHASPAIIVAMACLSSDSACQLAYCAIITALNGADDFAIESVIRFGAHVQIYTLVNKSNNLNVAVSACCSISAICKSGEIADLLCTDLNFTSAVVDFLARWPKEKRVQVEGFKSLVALSRSPDIAVNIYKQPGYLNQYNKTLKFIQDLVKCDKLSPEYNKLDIQDILAISTKEAKCTIC